MEWNISEMDGPCLPEMIQFRQPRCMCATPHGTAKLLLAAGASEINALTWGFPGWGTWKTKVDSETLKLDPPQRIWRAKQLNGNRSGYCENLCNKFCLYKEIRCQVAMRSARGSKWCKETMNSMVSLDSNASAESSINEPHKNIRTYPLTSCDRILHGQCDKDEARMKPRQIYFETDNAQLVTLRLELCIYTRLQLISALLYKSIVYHFASVTTTVPRKHISCSHSKGMLLDDGSG